MNYRPEIDGLRALAVIPVILFHAGFKSFSGGFVGVDVFFVISGYLITTIIIEDIENSRFNLLNFYERRARRILPALFFIMIVCFPFALVWMLPNQMKDFSQSLMAVSLFVSNVLFWVEDGYFGPNSEEKPLLHTWSLAVEEQFYFLFPIFLIFAWRFGKNKVFWMIFIMTAFSFFLCENIKWGWEEKLVAKFYLAPTRAWELLIGSITAFIIKKNGLKKNNFFAICGLVAIIFSIFVYNESTPFPSIYATLPVFGSALLILYGEKETLVARILSTKIFVGLGLISYSAYLWHQPLFAFTRIRLLKQPPEFLMICLSVFSIFIAFFTWKFIEKPFRNPIFLSRKKIFFSFLLGAVIFILVGLSGHLSNGFVERFSEEDRKFLGQINNEKNSEYVVKIFNTLRMSDWEDGDKKKVFLVGDSFGQDLTNAIYESGLLKNMSLSTWFIRSRCGNLFIPSVEKEKYIKKRYRRGCLSVNYFENKEVINRLKLADEVWLASAWKSWEIEMISKSLKNLEEITDAKIRIFGKKDFPFFKPQKYLGLSSEDRSLYEESIDSKSIKLNERLKELTKDYNFIDVQKIICGGNIHKCKIFDSNGDIKTYDGGHLTKYGARFYGEHLKKSLKDI